MGRSAKMEEAMKSLNMEERSNLEERKHEIQKEYNAYMVEHPELRQALNDFLTACLAERPDNIYKFARYWFSTSLPPLRPLTAATPASAAGGAAAATTPAAATAAPPAADDSVGMPLTPEQQKKVQHVMDRYEGA